MSARAPRAPAVPSSKRGAAIPRPRRSPGAPVLVVCTDLHHHDEPAYARYGHHLVGGISISTGPDGTGRLHWRGPRPESRDTARTSGILLSWPGIAPALPVKQFRRPDGEQVWRFGCTCGRNPEMPEPELAAIVRRHMEQKPGERLVIPLARLESARDRL
jgi:hypothetical protein